MPTKEEWVGKLRGHPWKKVQIRILRDFYEGTPPGLGGGILYDVRDPRNPGSDPFMVWEKWGPPNADGNYVVYRLLVVPDALKDFDFASLETVNPVYAETVKRFAASPLEYMQALAYLKIAEAIGPGELDPFPETLTREQLQARWPELDWGRTHAE